MGNLDQWTGLISTLGFPIAVAVAMTVIAVYLVRSIFASKERETTYYQDLYQQERSDRIASEERLAHALEGIKEIIEGIDELTREVIRGTAK